jgi:hypothetical protein
MAGAVSGADYQVVVSSGGKIAGVGRTQADVEPATPTATDDFDASCFNHKQIKVISEAICSLWDFSPKQWLANYAVSYRFAFRVELLASSP